jgi:hypothetical protein
VSQRGQTSIHRRPWATTLAAVVAVVGAAALVHAFARERSAGPTAAPTTSSTPASTPTYVKDDKQATCDKIDAARRDFHAALERADLVLDDPDVSPAKIQEQADMVIAALKALGSVATLAVVRSEDATLGWYAFHYGSFADDAWRFIELNRDDPQAIRSVGTSGALELWELRVDDLCRGRPPRAR